MRHCAFLMGQISGETVCGQTPKQCFRPTTLPLYPSISIVYIQYIQQYSKSPIMTPLILTFHSMNYVLLIEFLHYSLSTSFSQQLLLNSGLAHCAPISSRLKLCCVYANFPYRHQTATSREKSLRIKLTRGGRRRRQVS